MQGPIRSASRETFPISSIEHCFIQVRAEDQGQVMFDFGKDGRAVVRLHGYAIVPIEDFEELVAFRRRYVS